MASHFAGGLRYVSPPGHQEPARRGKPCAITRYRSPASEVADVAESLADRLMDLANVAHGVGVGLRDRAGVPNLCSMTRRRPSTRSRTASPGGAFPISRSRAHTHRRDVAESLADRLMDLANVAHGVGVGLRDRAGVPNLCSMTRRRPSTRSRTASPGRMRASLRDAGISTT